LLFTTLNYWLFFCVVGVVYFSLPRRSAIVALAIAGFVFYGFWNVALVLLLAASTLFNFLTGIAVDGASGNRRRLALTVAVAGNLCTLGVFKYMDFFFSSFAAIFSFSPDQLLLHLVLPVGISFYTFEGIAYNVDVYRGDMPATRSLTRFALFLSFFPHLIAGPIIRPQYFFPQIDRRRRPSAEATRWALTQVLKGLIKKLVFADNFAIFADGYFNAGIGQSGTLGALVGVLSFSMQIYFDFAGYTDIARGCAKLLGFDFPSNFERPYLSASIAAFWRRWHISLSTWLRHYLYIPLGGNRKGRGQTYINLMLVMTLGGLWHGANWNFLVWGAYHGVLLVVHRSYRLAVEGSRFEAVTESMLWRTLGILVTFSFVSAGWITFRTRSFAETVGVLGDLASPSALGGLHVPLGFTVLLAAIFLWIAVDRGRRLQDWLIAGGMFREISGTALSLMTLALFSRPEAIPFIYFQF
jgi:alginate O-acetyltransferase complex protein AlgI